MNDDFVADRQGLEVLDTDTCWALVESSPVGRVAFMHEGDPVILPVTHRLVGRSVVFRTTVGAKLDAALMARSAAFEVDAWDADTRTGWSVLMRGVADTVTDADELAVLDDLDLHPWADEVARDRWVRIRPDEISGRRIL